MKKTSIKNLKTAKRSKKKKMLGQFLTGIDVSSFQRTVDWQKVAATGAKFAYIKASEGVTITDSFFAANRKAAKAAGLIVGAYHLFRPKTAGAAEINNFVSAVGKIESGELPPVLDVEVPEDWKNIPVAARIKLVSDWLAAVEIQLGVRPIVYVNNSDAQGLLNHDPSFAKYLLWIAYYSTASQPVLPPPWKDWTFWQHTGVGTISGVRGNCDLDRFPGTLADLMKLVQP